MKIFKNPNWVNHELLAARSLDEIPPGVFSDIRSRLSSSVSANPIVSVVIAAWNEELNIVRCLDSLTRSRTDLPFEIIVINNNSTDRTQEVLDRLGATSYMQPVQGVGPSRELGQRMASGKFILSADADCVYPDRWIDIMTKALMTEGTAFVYGRFSYLSDDDHPRWKLFIFELARDAMSEIRHLRRPHLNTYGISLGYIRENGLREGHLDKNIRGFDGRLCFDMMKYGKVRVIRSKRAKAWTGTRALERDGNFAQAVAKRILRELARFSDYFTRAQQHNTKESANVDYSIRNSIDTLKRKLNPFHGTRK